MGNVGILYEARIIADDWCWATGTSRFLFKLDTGHIDINNVEVHQDRTATIMVQASFHLGGKNSQSVETISIFVREARKAT